MRQCCKIARWRTSDAAAQVSDNPDTTIAICRAYMGLLHQLSWRFQNSSDGFGHQQQLLQTALGRGFEQLDMLEATRPEIQGMLTPQLVNKQGRVSASYLAALGVSYSAGAAEGA